MMISPMKMSKAYPILLLCALVHVVDRHRIVYGSIADLGCGTGNFLRYVARKGVTAIGVDNSAAMLDIARKNQEAAGPVFSAGFARVAIAAFGQLYFLSVRYPELFS